MFFKTIICFLICLNSFAMDINFENFSLCIDDKQIASRVKKVAHQIDQKYQGEELMVVMILKGSVFLASDLMRALTVPRTLECIRCSSYGQNGLKAGELTIKGLENLDISGKNILLVDDIYDTGNTLYQVAQKLKQKKPKSLETLVLLTKGQIHSSGFIPDYILFEIENRFVVGYGLDYKEKYRGLRGVYMLKDDI